MFERVGEVRSAIPSLSCEQDKLGHESSLHRIGVHGLAACMRDCVIGCQNLSADDLRTCLRGGAWLGWALIRVCLVTPRMTCSGCWVLTGRVGQARWWTFTNKDREVDGQVGRAAWSQAA